MLLTSLNVRSEPDECATLASISNLSQWQYRISISAWYGIYFLLLCWVGLCVGGGDSVTFVGITPRVRSMHKQSYTRARVRVRIRVEEAEW